MDCLLYQVQNWTVRGFLGEELVAQNTGRDDRFFYVANQSFARYREIEFLYELKATYKEEFHA